MTGEDTTYLIFSLDGQRYALDTAAVERTVQLPELTAVPGAPRYVRGVFHLHGGIVPVLDLRALLKRPLARHYLTDSVIVLHGDGSPFGIIASEVMDVCSAPETGRKTNVPGSPSIIGQAVYIEQEIVFLPDSRQLTQLATAVETLLDWGAAFSEDKNEASIPENDERPFFQDISDAERAIFRERARNLVRLENDLEQTTGVTLAVIGLNGEYFGLPVEHVREFAEISNIAPVPCCPEQIVGNVNFRGDVLAVVDVRPSLRMPMPPSTPDKIVVVGHDGLTVGAVIDEVYETIQVDPARIAPLPLAADPSASKYLQGTSAYGEHVLTVLDLPKLLASGDLVVNEEV